MGAGKMKIEKALAEISIGTLSAFLFLCILYRIAKITEPEQGTGFHVIWKELVSISNFVLSPDGLILCALFLLSAIILSWVIKNNSNEYGTSPV